MITQLRPFYSAEELSGIYTQPYNHTRWEDHIIRVSVKMILNSVTPTSVSE